MKRKSYFGVEISVQDNLNTGSYVSLDGLKTLRAHSAIW